MVAGESPDQQNDWTIQTFFETKSMFESSVRFHWNSCVWSQFQLTREALCVDVMVRHDVIIFWEGDICLQLKRNLKTNFKVT
jgi:hypothetical protein